MKELVKNIVIYGISGTLSKFIGMLLLPVYVRVFSPAEYGILGMTLTAIAFLSIAAELQLPSAVGRFFFGDEKYAIIRQGLTILLATSLFFASLTFLFAPIISTFLFSSSEHSVMLRIGAFSLIIGQLNSYFLYILRLDNRPVMFLVLSISSTVISLSGSLLFVLQFDLGIAGAMLGQLSGIALTLPFLCNVYRKSLVPIFDSQLFLKLVKYSLPQVPAQIGGWFQQSFGQGVMLLYLTLTDLGIYIIALRIASALQLFQLAFSYAWFPYAMKYIDDPANKVVYARGLRFNLTLSAFISIPVILFAPEIMAILTTPDYFDAYKAIGFVSLAMTADGIVNTGTLGLHVTKKPIYYTYSYIISIVANIVFTITGYMVMGATGIPFGYMMGRLTQAVIAFFFSQRYYYIKHFNARNGAVLGTLVFSTVIVLFSGADFVYIRVLILAVLLVFLFFVGFEKSLISFVKSLPHSVKTYTKRNP